MEIFWIGVLSSIVSSTLFYLLRYHLGFIINLFFFMLYPKVSGEYEIYSYRKTDSKIEEGENNILEGESNTLPRDPTDRQLLVYLKKIKKPEHIFLKLKQFANRVIGTIYIVQEDGSIQNIEKVNGKITASRVMILNSEAAEKDHHNFGTYLLTLGNDTNIMKGVRSYLCISCGDANPKSIMLERKK